MHMRRKERNWGLTVVKFSALSTFSTMSLYYFYDQEGKVNKRERSWLVQSGETFL